MANKYVDVVAAGQLPFRELSDEKLRSHWQRNGSNSDCSMRERSVALKIN